MRGKERVSSSSAHRQTSNSAQKRPGVLVIWLLAQRRIGSFGGRIGFVVIAGILAAITANVSYWNLYGFPAVYTAGYVLIYSNRDRWLRSRWNYCRVDAAKAHSGSLILIFVCYLISASHRALSMPVGHLRCHMSPLQLHRWF